MPSTSFHGQCLAGIAAILLAGCGGDSLTPILSCENSFGIDVDCGFQNPEDMALAPDGRIIVSQFGGMDGSPGSLVLYEPQTRSLTTLFPVPSARREPEWGDPSCAFPKAFSPHGIDLQTRSDGRHQLASSTTRVGSLWNCSRLRQTAH